MLLPFPWTKFTNVKIRGNKLVYCGLVASSWLRLKVCKLKSDKRAQISSCCFLGTMVCLNISNQNIIFFFSKLWQLPSHWQWNMKSMVKTTPHMPLWLLLLGSALCSYLLPLFLLVVLGGMHFTDRDIPRSIIWWMDSKK